MAQAATLTNTTGITAAQITDYRDQFLTRFKEILVVDQFGQKVPVPQGSGATIDMFRYHPLAKVTAAMSEGDKAPTGKKIQGFAIQATLADWGDYIEFSMLHYHTSRDRHLSQATDLVATQAAESNERQIIKTLAEKCIWPIPANAIDSTGAISASLYNEDITFGSVPSTTIVRLKTGTVTLAGKAINKKYVGGWITFSKGAAYGHCSRISVYASASLALTMADAAPEIPQSAGNTTPSKVVIASPFMSQGLLTSANKILTSHFMKAQEILFKNGAQPFDNGKYACLVSPEVHTQLLGDTKWRDTAVRQVAATDGGYRNGKVAEWGGFDFYRMTTRARYTSTTQSYTGANAFAEDAGHLYVTFCLGQNAFGIPGLEGVAEPQLSIDIPKMNEGNPAVPIKTYGTMSWYRSWVVKALNANFSVGIISYV